MGRRNQHRYKCYDCRFPACKQCHARPLHAVSHTAWLNDEYTCIKCKYPPCTGCGKEAPSTKYRFLNWTCKECKENILTADAAHEKKVRESAETNTRTEASMPERSPKALKSAFKSCDNCGETKTLNAFRRVHHSEVPNDCRACQLPTCNACGRQRTENESPFTKSVMKAGPWCATRDPPTRPSHRQTHA